MVRDGRTVIGISPLINNSPSELYLLPVTPQIISVTNSQEIIRDVVVNSGEVSQLGNSKLKGLRFSSFFPQTMDSYVNVHNESELDTPETWIFRIQDFMTRPLLVIINNLPVYDSFIINSFTPSLIAGLGKEISYTLNLVQYRSVAVRSITFNEQVATVFPRVPIDSSSGDYSAVQTYVVKQGDTWASISQKLAVPVNKLFEFGPRTNAFFLKAGDIIHYQTTHVLRGSTDKG